jgi:hypothetical protein
MSLTHGKMPREVTKLFNNFITASSHTDGVRDVVTGMNRQVGRQGC